MELIIAKGVPAAIGPYSHAVRTNNVLYASGQVPLDPETGAVVGTTIEEQAARTLGNLEALLKDQGLCKKNIAKVTVYLSDFNMFADFNKCYADFMGEHRPARTCVEVSRLPKDVLLEVDATAVFE